MLSRTSLSSFSLPALLLFLAVLIVSPLAAQVEAPADLDILDEPDILPDSPEALEGDEEDMVDRIVFRDETTDQVLALLERLTGRSVIRPHQLPAATFTFNSQQPLTRQEAVDAIKTMLSINGIAVTELGEHFLTVIPAGQVRTHAPEMLTPRASELPPSGRIVSRIYHFEFLDINEVQTQLNLMLSADAGSIVPFEKSNALLITDTVRNLQAMEELMDRVDRPTDFRTEVRFIQIDHAQAGEVVSAIESLTGTAAGEALAAGTTLHAEERSNQIVLATDRRQIPYFENLIEQFDIPAEPLTRTEVIPLRHADAVEVASLLSQIATGQAVSPGVGARRDTGPLRPGVGPGTQRGIQPGMQRGGTQRGFQRGARPGMQRGRTGGGFGQGAPIPQSTSSSWNDGSLDMTRAAQEPPMPPDAPSPEPTPTPDPSPTPDPAAPAPSPDPTPFDNGVTDYSEYLTILADERSNAVILSGTSEDIRKLTELLEELDIGLSQVRIDVFIAEVSLTESDGRGIDVFDIEYESGPGITGEIGGPEFGFELLGTDPFAFELALGRAAARSDINVLSVPTIVTTHNREASIVVAEERPIITGSFTDQIAGTRQQVQYRPIGIQLYVRPLIGVDGTVQLEIDQAVDDVGPEPAQIGGDEQPIIITRTANSFVTVHTGETIILGGMQSTGRTESMRELGILGRIPIFGNLFTRDTYEENRTELMVFIRPTVLETTKDAHTDARREIDKHTLRDRLQEKIDGPVRPVRPHGLSDEAYELRERILERGFDPEDDPVEYR